MKLLPVHAFLLIIPLELISAPVRFDVVYDKSSLAARTDKAGMLAALGAGHKHGIVATKFAANVCADPQTLQEASVSIRVPSGALRIDSADARRAAGLTDSGPGVNDVATIQEKMLSAANLAVSEHPEIRFESTSAERKGNQVIVRGPLTIRGRSTTVSVPLRAEPEGTSYRFKGELQMRLTDYGIKPESVGGVVKVADQVTILIDVLAIPGRESCK